MKLDATTLPFLLISTFSLAGPALAATPAAGSTSAAAASAVAPAPSGPGAAAPLPDAVESGAEALPPAAIPAPRLVRSAESQARSGSRDPVASGDDTADSPEIQVEVEAESAELEDVRRAEESAHVNDAPSAPGQAAPGFDGLGLESPIRDRLEGALSRQATAPAGEGGRIELLPEIDHDLATLQGEYDIPIDVNSAVVAYIRFFQSPGVRPHFVKWLGRSHRYIDRYRQIMKEEGIPQDTVYLAMIESGFGNFAYSRARASGPWQFIAPTGRMFGLDQDFWVDERRDPERSAHAAARFLKRLYQQTGDWRLAWAGYNAGLGRIASAQRKGYADFWSMAAVKGKHVLRPETKGYVPKLMAAAIIAKHPEAFGFKPEEIERESWNEYTEVEIPSATLLSVVAKAAGVSEREIIDLNPELRRSCTPPRSYTLKIPASSEATFAEAWPDVHSKVRTTFAGHVIRRGDTLGRIAAEYGVPVQGIMEMNNLRDGRRLRVGTELLIPRPMNAAPVAEARTPEEQPRRAAAERRVRPAPVVAASSTRAAAGADRTVLRVRAGDTLWSISQKYGVELVDLCRWNGIKSPNRHKLLSGQRLVVYTERG
jgi:membrane-bound lytic murein transglycosylase D